MGDFVRRRSAAPEVATHLESAGVDDNGKPSYADHEDYRGQHPAPSYAVSSSDVSSFDEPEESPLSSYKPRRPQQVPSRLMQGGDVKGSPTLATASWFDTHEAWIPWLVVLVSAITRFYRLDQPRGVVFDEGHFGRFTNQYTDGQFLFDIHPPLGKLVFYWVGLLVGYDHTVCEYSPRDHRELYQPTCKFIFIRATAAAFGTFTPLWVYHIARNWGTSVAASTLAAAFVIFDILNVIEARLILVDSQLIFWVALALLTAQRWWRRLNEHAAGEEEFAARFKRPYSTLTDFHVAHDPRLLTELERWKWCLWCGFVFGCSISVKWTGLATPAMIGIESFMALFFLRKAVPWYDLIRIAITALCTYAHWFWWHFHVGKKTADGDAFMFLAFRQTIVGSGNYDPSAPKPPFWSTFFYLNREMLRANASITQRHPWETVWYEWLLNLRGLLYYSYDVGHTYTQGMYLIGHPLIIWGVFASMLGSVVGCFLYLRAKHAGGIPNVASLQPFFTRIAYCLAAYWWNLIPYVFVKRSCFLYHYIPGLMYGELMLAMMIDKLSGRSRDRVVLLALFAVVSCYLFYAPWVYALPLTSEGHDRRRWLPRWN